MIRHKNILLVLAAIITATLFIQCVISRKMPAANVITNGRGEQLAGSAACADCHQPLYDSYIRTAHYQSTQLADTNSIKGKIAQLHENYFFNYSLRLSLERTDSGIYQAAYRSDELTDRQRFDITVGSGRKGQSYLYWKGDSLFQLPLTYFTALHGWVNSPGFPSDQAVFSRPIVSVCLDCHATNFKEKDPKDFRQPSNVFLKDQVILGIGCEKCHGAAQKHVDFHRANPGEPAGKYIINIKKLDRNRQLDVCAACHSGMREPLKPAFSYQPGQPLDEYSRPLPSEGELDVHGNQYGLLKKSKCFLQSKMNCSSCHDPHKEERNLQLLSSKCMNCHDAGRLGGTHLKLANTLTNNCIDCHMPVQKSQTIQLLAEGRQVVHDLIRTHYIRIYPEETQAFLKRMSGE